MRGLYSQRMDQLLRGNLLARCLHRICFLKIPFEGEIERELDKTSP